jgi:hypothetical protein
LTSKIKHPSELTQPPEITTKAETLTATTDVVIRIIQPDEKVKPNK